MEILFIVAGGVSAVLILALIRECNRMLGMLAKSDWEVIVAVRFISYIGKVEEFAKYRAYMSEYFGKETL